MSSNEKLSEKRQRELSAKILYEESLRGYYDQAAISNCRKNIVDAVSPFFPGDRNTEIWWCFFHYMWSISGILYDDCCEKKRKIFFRVLHKTKTLHDMGVHLESINITKESIDLLGGALRRLALSIFHKQLEEEGRSASNEDFFTAHKMFYGRMREAFELMAGIENAYELKFQEAILNDEFNITPRTVMEINGLSEFEVMSGDYSEKIKLKIFEGEQ